MLPMPLRNPLKDPNRLSAPLSGGLRMLAPSLLAVALTVGCGSGTSGAGAHGSDAAGTSDVAGSAGDTLGGEDAEQPSDPGRAPDAGEDAAGLDWAGAPGDEGVEPDGEAGPASPETVDGTGADPASCPDEPPDAEQALVCQEWKCEEAPAPTCWTCAAAPAADGTACTPAGAGNGSGTCQAGVCKGATDPGAPGKHTFSTGTAELEVAGGILPTIVGLTLYLPDGPGPHPVVVLLHGFQLQAAQYASYGEHLASWGYVVVMPQMPSSLFGGPNHKELKEHLIEVLDWVEEMASVEDGPLGGKADSTHIGLAGHSMGGKIALLTATEDARALAVFGIDPVDAVGSPLQVSSEAYPSVTPELMDLLTVPIALLGETTNATCVGFMCQACAPKDDNFHQYYVHATGPALEIEVLGASHMSFLDNPDCGLVCSMCPAGTDDPSATRQLTRRYMTAFFDAKLRGEAACMDWLTGQAMAEDEAAGLVASESKNGL